MVTFSIFQCILIEPLFHSHKGGVIHLLGICCLEDIGLYSHELTKLADYSSCVLILSEGRLTRATLCLCSQVHCLDLTLAPLAPKMESLMWIRGLAEDMKKRNVLLSGLLLNYSKV